MALGLKSTDHRRWRSWTAEFTGSKQTHIILHRAKSQFCIYKFKKICIIFEHVWWLLIFFVLRVTLTETSKYKKWKRFIVKSKKSDNQFVKSLTQSLRTTVINRLDYWEKDADHSLAFQMWEFALLFSFLHDF